jgi:hypothetical protein
MIQSNYQICVVLTPYDDRYIKGGKERGKFGFQTGFSVLKSPSQMSDNVAFLIYFFKSFPTVYESSRSDKNWPTQISRKSSALSDQVETSQNAASDGK